MDKFNRLLGNQQVLQAIAEGIPPVVIEQKYAADLEAFKNRRQPYLLYP
jgi:hypothetical protein